MPVARWKKDRLYRRSGRRRHSVRDGCRRVKQAAGCKGRESLGRDFSELVARWKADRLCIQERGSTRAFHRQRGWNGRAAAHQAWKDLLAARLVAGWEMDFVSLHG